MSQGILNVSSNQPFAPIENVRAVGAQPSVADVSDKTLSEIYAEYKKLFIDVTGKYPTGTSYPDLLKGTLYRLGHIIFQNTTDGKADKYGDDFSKLSEIYNDSRTLAPDGTTVDGLCREGYMALRFYVKSIVDHLEMLNAYIQEAQATLEKLQEIIDMPDIDKDEKLQLARAHIDKLSVCKTFSDETVDALVKHVQYNNDTKQWEIVKDPKEMLFGDQDPYSQISTMGTYANLEALRKTLIAYKDSSASGGLVKAPIMVFSSLSLIDRMKFIYYYYKLIAGGCADYTRFPDDPETGFPCIPDVESTKDTEATKHLGALEMFYVGYLTDRDGPINAVSSFFEIKVQALRENLSIQSKSISALNTYMEFINRGMSVLNSSQSGADGDKTKHRIPDGAAVALLYLCGGNMYNLFEAKDGTKCLVIENDKVAGNYMLVSADEAGMNLLMGDTGNAEKDGQRGNCGTTLTAKNGIMYCDEFYSYQYASKSGDENKKVNLFSEISNVCSYYTSKDIETLTKNTKTYYGYAAKAKNLDISFSLPTRIDCAKVIPSSVKNWPSGDSLNFDSSGKIKTEVVSSWTNAFETKTRFINTAIDTINTDIQVDRSKIDSFDSICSTFRSRAHEAHSNTAANVR